MKIVHKRNLNKNKVLLTSVKFLLNESEHHLRVKGFHENEARDELRNASMRIKGITAILKSCGSNICTARNRTEIKNRIRNHIIPGLPRISSARQTIIIGLSHIILRFILIC
jgi:hypothetical protein